MRLAAYYFTQISRLLLAIFILLIAADLILIGSMFIRRCQIQDPVSFQTIVSVAAAPIIFYAAYGALVAGMLFYFLRYFMDGKGVYTLRSLPMGALGLLWSMFIAMLSAMILLWAAQLLAIYLGYGLYRMEVLLYNLPGNVDGMSRIGFSVIVPDREWLPPANDLYLAFIRTPFLQLFYPRHPVFWRLRRSWWFCRLFQGLTRCLPCVSGGRGRCCRFYFAGALFSSGWWKGRRRYSIKVMNSFSQ